MPGNCAPPPCLRTALAFTAIICGGALLPWSAARGQARVVRVTGDDGERVAFANVTLSGERPRITDDRGELALTARVGTPVTMDVRRLGYEPWYGTLAIVDTVPVVNVTLHRISRRMFTVKITDSSRTVPAYLRGFYERMLARQRGIGSGMYLTPEEVDKHNANLASALLQGINGVSLMHTTSGKIVAMNSDGSCQMTVLIDGHRVCPEDGCDANSPSSSSSAPGAGRKGGRTFVPKAPPRDGQFVLLDNLINENEIAAIEVYPRGTSLPASLPTVDASCGLIAIWTGGRRAP